MIGPLLLLACCSAALAMPQVGISQISNIRYNCPPLNHFLLPHEYDCTKFYYCDHGVRRVDPTDCAAGTEFSFEKQVCIHPELANCNLPGVPPTDSEETNQENGQSSDSSEASDENNGDGNNNGAASTEDGNNSSDGNNNNSSDGNNNNSSNENNTNGATSNESSNDSDSNNGSDENNNSSVDNNDSSDDNENSSDGNTDGSDNNGSNNVDNECPTNGDDLLVPKESDCSKFYKCAYGKKVEYSCPANLWFDANRLICDYPQFVQCGDGNAPPSENNRGSDEDNTDGAASSENNNSADDSNNNNSSDDNNNNSSDNNNGSDNNGSNNVDDECPTNGDDLLLPKESDCSKFYKCAYGKKVEYSCPANLWFDANRLICDYPQFVQCGNGNAPTTENNRNSDEDNTSGAASTENNNSSEENNNNSSDNDNSSDDNNNSSDNNNGSDNNGSNNVDDECPTNGDDLLLPKESDCSKFYKCAYGKKVEYSCPANLWFDANRLICDYPQFVQCGNSNAPPAENNRNSDEDNTDGAASTENNNSSEDNNNNSSGDNNNSSDGSEADGSNNGECPTNGDELLLSHESDCGLFYQCVHGNKVEMPCPSGLYFNAAKQECDWPENVACGNRCATECHVGAWAHADCDKYWRCEGDRQVVVSCSQGLHYNAGTQNCDFVDNAGCGAYARRF